MPQSRASVPTQSHSSSQVYTKPVMDERKLQNIWTMRPLGGTGGALKALAKNVAQHMNLNRSTLKRVVAQVVAEHHNLGQVDDYKGHMYYAKPERLNFLNLLAQSKEALDDLLLLDPRLAKKFQHSDQVKKHQKPSRVSSQFKVRSRSKTKLLGATPKKVTAAPAQVLGRGISTFRLPTTQARKSPRKPVQTLKKPPPSPTAKTPPAVVKDVKDVKDVQQEQRTASRTRTPFRSRSCSPQAKTKRAPRVHRTSSSLHRLPAGSTKRLAGSGKTNKVTKVSALPKTKTKSKSKSQSQSQSQMKAESKVKVPPNAKTGKVITKPTKGKSSKQVEQAKSADTLRESDPSDTEVEPVQSRLVAKSVSQSRYHSGGSTHRRRRRRWPRPSPSSTTATTLASCRSLRRRQQPDETLTTKVLTKALTKALAKAFPQPAKSQARMQDRQRSPTAQATPSFRNYEKPWQVSRGKTRRLVAGSLEKDEKRQQQQLKKHQPKQHQKRPQKKQQQQQQQKEKANQKQAEMPRKPRSHVGQQMRKVDFPWYTPYQFQGGAGATQQPSPRSSSTPLMARNFGFRQQQRPKRIAQREEAIDNMLNYGSGLFRRHRGEWIPARKMPKDRQRKITRRSSSLQARWKAGSKRGRSAKTQKSPPKKEVKEVKPSTEGFNLPPPPPSAVSSDDRVRPRRKAPAKAVDSSLGSYADLLQPSDSKEALSRSKRRLSIAFMSKHGKGSRHRQVPPIWK
ncbi:hypothetical protein KR038_007284 [Drosophila bunnanda]|nr:hypothetical protein KR038_007284 [Drosophila bunnanda]